MDWLTTLNFVIGIAFAVCYSYQLLYLLLSLFFKPRRFPDVPSEKRYAVLISARNESAVIGHLLDSIRAQDYPADRIDTFVVADNCTDDTAAVAREHGAHTYERLDREQVGKGFALRFLTEQIRRDFGEDRFDAFLVIDADNLLTPTYITEMHKCFSAGNRIVTSYRNSKNYGDNWISAGYGLWFLHEARGLNHPRSLLRTSCAVSGTGFLVAKEVLWRQGGWNHFLLTEDIEFTVDQILQGERVCYCHAARLYDEQPVKFRQSFRQRLRWSKGYLQILRRYGVRLFRGLFGRNSFSCFDMFMNIAPAYLLTTVSLVANVGGLVYASIFNSMALSEILLSAGQLLFRLCGMAFLLGVLTTVCEWREIRCHPVKKILYCFTFPLYMLTYVPISFTAMFARVQWKPIDHTVSVDLGQVMQKAKK